MNPSEGARAMNRARWDKDPRTSHVCAECGAAMDTRRMFCGAACRQRDIRRRRREAAQGQPKDPKGRVESSGGTVKACEP